MEKIIFIPENINIDQLLESHPPDFKFKKDNFALILSMIPEKITKDNYNYDFTPLHSKTLQSIAVNYLDYINYLKLHNIIIVDNFYIVGELPKAYNFSNDYSTQLSPYYISDSTIIRKITRYDNSLFYTSDKLRFLSKWFNPKLQINYEKAVAHNWDNYCQLQKSPDYDKAYKKYLYADTYINKIHFKKFIFSRDTTSFRIHSNLTRINKKFRKFIKYDNNTLVEIDLKNSQPYLCQLLFNPEFYLNSDYKYCLYNLKRKIYNTMLKNNSIKELIKFLSDSANIDSDIKCFVDESINGNFYNSVIDKFNSLFKYKTFDRDQIKDIMFNVFFSDNRFISQHNAVYKNKFRSLYPNVYEVFKLIKKGNKNHLSVILQTIESRIIIDNICKKISKTYPQLPVFTIHDSIVTIKGYEQNVINIINDVFLEIFNNKPVLSTKFWEEISE